MSELRGFLRDDAGAITIDWVTLTAGVLIVGMVVVFAIYNAGVAPVVIEMNASVVDEFGDVERGKGIDCNTFGSC